MIVLWLVVAILALAVAAWRPDLFVYAGLLLASSNRFLTLQVHHGFTLKPGHMAFSLALGGAVIRHVRHRTMPRLPDVPRSFLVFAGALLALYLVAAAAGAHTIEEGRELLVIGVGAIVPALAIVLCLDSRERLARGLACFVLAQLLVALYALYQFAAGYLHLPVPVAEKSVVGSVHRVSAFSYEPAYYGAYVITALPLLLCDVVRGRRRLGRRVPPIAVATVVALAGALTISRAAYLAVPFVVAGAWYLLRTQPAERKVRVAHALVPFAVVVVVVGAIGAATGFDVARFAQDRIRSFTETDRPSSNGLRLGLYRAVDGVIADHLVLGVGPGNLGNVLPRYGGRVPQHKKYVATANDIWLQGAVDAGVLSIPLIAGLLWGTAAAVRRRSPLSARALALGALVFLVVNGAFVSFLWDMKFWTVMGLAFAIHRGSSPGAADGSEAGARQAGDRALQLSGVGGTAATDPEDPTPLPG
ncbi:MAG: O-antigen ligase family protein [Actinomycetota bacterium]